MAQSTGAVNQPKSVPLNTEGGYRINQFTGVEIQSIINSLGDTVQTGKPITIEPVLIDLDSTVAPNVVPAGDPIVIPANQNITPEPDELRVVPINPDQLKRTALKTPDLDSLGMNAFHPDHHAITSIGDTIATGMPLEIIGKIVQPSAPQISAAAPPRMRDNARFDIQYLDAAHGLIDPYVFAMLQDDDGNFWLGSNMGGLTRYDGERFVTYTRDEGLSGNIVITILRDRKGNIWAGTADGGITVFDGHKFIHYSVAEGFINDSIASLFEDSVGNIWIGTSGGVSRFDGDKFTHFTENEGLSGSRVTAILEDEDGVMWFGTSNSGLNRFDGKEFTAITIEDGLPDTGVNAIQKDANGHLWVGTWAGVAKYDGRSLTTYAKKEGITDSIISEIYRDQKGILWFATFLDGLIKYDGERFTRISESDGLSSNAVNCIFEGEDGILWLGTNGGGINRYHQNGFRHFIKSADLDHRSALAVMQDQSGNYWFSNSENGIARYNGRIFEHFTTEQGLSGNAVWSVLEDSDGNIWMGTNGDGVNKYDGKTFTHYTVQNGLPFHTVENMVEDDEGNIWFGTWKGVVKFDGNLFYNYTMESGLSANQVWSLYKDRQGNLWFGTYSGGVIKFDGKQFTGYTEKEGLSGNNVYSIVEDHGGNLWFGTDGNGLNKFDGKQFVYYTKAEGLAHNIIRSLLKDNDGNIWAGTDGGLSRLNASGQISSDQLSVTNYGIESGLKGVDLSFTSSLLDSKNRAWWGSGQSLVMLDLNTVANTGRLPVVHLARVDINGQQMSTDEVTSPNAIEFAGMEPFYQYPVELKNSYDQNHLTFHVAGIDWAAPHKIKYSYKLDGLDDDWSPPTGDSQIDYRNLTHGDYTFNVRAAGGSGSWSEPVQYSFVILPPWWHTWWAYGFYSILIISFLFGLDRYRQRFARERQARLEEMIEHRTVELRHEKKRTEMQAQKLKELDADKNRFFANISHEFRTPLTLTIAPLENLKNKKYGDVTPEGERQIDMAIRNARRLMKLVGQLLDLARFEAYLFKLKPKNANLNHYLHLAATPFIGAAERHNLRFDIQLPDEEIIVKIDPEQFEKVISNLLSNAFKFTPNGGTVAVSLQSGNEEAVIKITDSGPGIPAKHLPRLFDRFYQVEKSELQPGSGIGLALVKEITEQHGGRVAVESETGKGTEFTVFLPLVDEQTLDVEPAIKPPITDHDPEEKRLVASEAGAHNEDPLPVDERKTVMVIDDNRDIRSYLREQFSEEYNVVEAASGSEALDRIHGLLPDVIVSDIMMPDGDGFSLLKELRSNSGTNFLPVILLTARAEAEDKLEGLGIGADDYLTKPFSMDEVAARVHNLIERQKRLQKHFAKQSGDPTPKTVLHPDPVETDAADEVYLEKVRTAAQENMHDEDFSVEELADLMFQSRTQLFRRMKELTDESPSGFIKRMRLERGAELLAQKAGTVSEIAYSTGFRSVAQFSKSFRDRFDETPTSYASNTT